jgi:hypothetical protein
MRRDVARVQTRRLHTKRFNDWTFSLCGERRGEQARASGRELAVCSTAKL